MVATDTEDVVAVLGDKTVLVFVIAHDNPPVSPDDVVWFFNNGITEVEIAYPGDGRRVIAEDRLSLYINGTTFADEGIYTLLASNAAGQGVGASSLDVQGNNPPPPPQ